MARDVSAATIQGPDNASGNPVPVSIVAGGGGPTNVNITQVAGAAVTTATTPVTPGEMLVAVDLQLIRGSPVALDGAGFMFVRNDMVNIATSPILTVAAGELLAGTDHRQVNGVAAVVETAGKVSVTDDLRSVNGAAVVTAASGVQKVGIADAFGNSLASYMNGDAAQALHTEPEGCTPTGTISVANAAAAITITGVAGQKIRLKNLTYQYDGGNAQTVLTVVDGAVTKYSILVPAASMDAINLVFPEGGLRMSAGNNMVITLPAGGAGVKGYLNFSYNIY